MDAERLGEFSGRVLAAFLAMVVLALLVLAFIAMAYLSAPPAQRQAPGGSSVPAASVQGR